MLEVLEMVLRCSSGRGEPAEESRSDVHFGYGGGQSWEVELRAFFFFFFKSFSFFPISSPGAPSAVHLFFFLSFLLFFFLLPVALREVTGSVI